ncbi:MAG: hypothetical protein QOH90_245 [Actinomycetota bacterium]|nr:hypothetical protein [Actinomycetota bacterium]
MNPDLIKTPDQRLRVFVSGSVHELSEERAAAGQAIRNLHLTPVMLELGARAHAPRDLYRSYLEQSHIFIGIYGERYGWVPPGEEISILEDEYSIAEGLPKLIYVKEVPERDPQLQRLMLKARDDGKVSYRPFTTATELAGFVENDLAVLLTERFEEGRAHSRRPQQKAKPENSPLLPIQPTPFVGRERDVKEICSLLEREDIRLLSLVGPGGIGKSRLAFHVAELRQDSYGDGLRFALLSSITEPDLTLTAIGKSVGIAESTQRSILENLKEFLADKEMLLLLDNFEHLLDAAPSLSELLGSCPGLNILVTSRAALRIRDEHEYQVPPLEFPALDRRVSAADIAGCGGVRLFVGRARAAKPGFTLTDENAEAVSEIVSRLDGLPLAIELAAARSRLLTPDAILARLNKSLELLTHGPLDLPPRQRTLRAALDWDYELLSPEEQKVFRRLAVFAGSFTIAAAEAVAGRDEDEIDLLDNLDSLINKSLLLHVVPVQTDPRFHMLKTIREYALEKLVDDPDGEEILARHAQYYLARAETAVPGLRAPDQVYWLRVLERDHDNLRAALQWASSSPAASEIELKICGALARFWEYRGYLSEGQRWLEGALSRAGNAPAELRARCLDGAGILARGQGEFKRAVQLLEECLQLRRELGDTAALATTLRNLGNAWFDRGDPERARSLNEESLELQRQVGNKSGIAAALNNLGVVAVHVHDWESAAPLYTEALQYFRELDDKQGIARGLMNLGEVRMETGDFEGAAKYLRESFILFQELSARWDIAYLLEEMAYVAHGSGRSADGARLYGAAEVHRERLGAPLSVLEKALYDSHVAEVRAALGPIDFEANWAAGRSLDAQEAFEVLFSG